MTSGFGIDVNWDWDKAEIPKGHTMPFMQALSTATDGMPLRFALPNWLLLLSKSGREVVRGYYEFEVSHYNTRHHRP